MVTATTRTSMAGTWVVLIVALLMELTGILGAATIIRCAAPLCGSDQ